MANVLALLEHVPTSVPAETWSNQKNINGLIPVSFLIFGSWNLSPTHLAVGGNKESWSFVSSWSLSEDREGKRVRAAGPWTTMDRTRGHSVKLNDGHFIPVLGLGTYAPDAIPKSRAGEATKVAIEVGYRHIDAAYAYQNENEVGQGIREKIADGTVKREDIFYTTKLWGNFFRPELVKPALERSLKKLQLDYVDLFLIHMPCALKPGEELMPEDASGKLIFDTVDIRDTWEALEKCKDLGLAKSIGVSNFNHKQLEMILNKPGLKYKPTCNQVECHPYLNQSKLLEFCKSKDIVLVAYSALGSTRDPKWVDSDSPHLLEEPVLKAIAKNHHRSPAQVALRYQLQRGVVVLARSFGEKRIKENFQVFDFELTEEDMKAMVSLDRNLRLATFPITSDHKDYPFPIEY
ncbi:aldo-keto reductase family 1 member C15-like isoform X2 [Eulemur rufifrons]|uniref:aldo-keto reductase family 1 member C15-like isoform X2 n=1 Tax=Eulemur rufifrons TaxID=859984 RepID=UPI003741EE24